ncbi:CLUMA_CG019427, isoform A [Clunio marinus]|uniref:CLUMA_CG019427, isoform A n=1 Tax=Clunio marinus TaxID=568069 RepID=A0A1J1J2S5_9DIPT|nr:CLUMA_CG019427, isoform A [Clunio marinus]
MAQAHVPLTPFHPSLKHTDRERFICIYPAYLDAKKSVQEGRKVPKEYCIENPTYQEIKDVLTAANMNLVIENKIYPKERSKEILHRGRVRVQIKHEDGTPINPDLATRREILKYIGGMIPQLKSRIANPKGGELPAQSTSQQQTGGKKSKGKKR